MVSIPRGALVLACMLAWAASAQGQEAKKIPAPADVSAVPEDAESSASGLAWRVLEAGSGSSPSEDSWVKVDYTGWTTDGEMFDSSKVRGKPSVFGVGKVIAGWTEALQLMAEGETRRLWIPEELAYSGRSRGPQGMLVFDVELLEVIERPVTPQDVAAPPPDAVKEKGIFSKVLVAGTGTAHPGARSRVRVHYTGWTTDGEMFDSSLMRGEPSSFSLDQVISGWTRGLRLMVEGETRRLWIPERLAYGGQAGAPQGMLVFDIELLAIER